MKDNELKKAAEAMKSLEMANNIIIKNLREKLSTVEIENKRLWQEKENQRRTIEKFHEVYHKYFGYIDSASYEELDEQLSNFIFIPCGEGDNICSCKNKAECGYRNPKFDDEV